MPGPVFDVGVTPVAWAAHDPAVVRTPENLVNTSSSASELKSMFSNLYVVESVVDALVRVRTKVSSSVSPSSSVYVAVMVCVPAVLTLPVIVSVPSNVAPVGSPATVMASVPSPPVPATSVKEKSVSTA